MNNLPLGWTVHYPSVQKIRISTRSVGASASIGTEVRWGTRGAYMTRSHRSREADKGPRKWIQIVRNCTSCWVLREINRVLAKGKPCKVVHKRSFDVGGNWRGLINHVNTTARGLALIDSGSRAARRGSSRASCETETFTRGVRSTALGPSVGSPLMVGGAPGSGETLVGGRGEVNSRPRPERR